MNQTGVPIGFQNSNQTFLTFPASEGAIPIRCPASQSFPYTISPDLSVLWNNQSSYANDQSGEEVRYIIKPTSGKRKKPVFWTKEEHQNFLSGIELYGKGKWNIIAKQVVKTKTPSQVSSHAQKHYIRQNLALDKRKRSSIHDTTVADVISPQKKPRQLHVESPIGHPTPPSQQQPQHAMALTAQPPAPVESQAVPSTSYGPAPVESQAVPSTSYGPSPVESQAVPSTSYAPVPVESQAVPSTSYAPAPVESQAVPSTSYAPAPVESQAVPSTSYAPVPVESQAVPSTSYGPAPVESQAVPSTSYAPAPKNVNQFDDLLYLPEWGWSSRFG